MYRSLGQLRTVLAQANWPVDFFSADDLPAYLDKIYVLDYEYTSLDEGFYCRFQLAFLGELAIGLPGLDGVKLVAAGDIAGFTLVTASWVVGPQSYLTLQDITLALRFDPKILKAAVLHAGDPILPYVEIQLTGSIQIDDSFDISFTGFDALNLTPAEIGSSGIIIAANDVKLDLSCKSSLPEVVAAGFDDTFIGVFIGEADVTLPKGFPPLAPQDLLLRNCVIGSGGVSGLLQASYGASSFDSGTGKFTGSGAGDIFGVPFGLESILIEFKAGTLVQSAIKGQIKVPFFDHVVDVSIGFDLDGTLSVGIDGTFGDGLGHLSISGVLDLELDSLKFEVAAGVLTATISGKLTPTFPGLTWPAIDIKDLKIDSKGHVQLPGGWLDLPTQYGFDFHGFQVDITKFGMGRNDDGTKWIGFSGDVKLVAGLPAGASVDGLRITANDDWSHPQISFSGVKVALEVKDVLSFKGAVAYRTFTDSNNAPVHRFDGSITLKLDSLNLTIDGALVVGSVAATNTAPSYNFFAIYVGVELPTGAPLAATGLAFYGVSGLLAIEMEPDKHAGESWYGIGAGVGWYKRGTVGVADLAKWRNASGSKAFGAGMKVGTYADNGYTFNGSVLLAVVFPGPLVLLEGKANLLTDRAKLGTDEPIFDALAVFDNRPPSRSLLVGIDAKYKYNSTGRLIAISGGTEAYYNFEDPTAWHIYLGEKEPRERRIQANILSLFSANAYVMIDAHQLALGAWVGFDQSWQFGPLGVTLQAWMESNAVISYKPAHLYGDLWAHGAVDLEAFGFGAGLTLDARIAADVFNPFHVLGDFDVEFKLPWPFKKKHLGAQVTLEWGPEPTRPPLPVALKDIAIEHFKATVKWPLATLPNNPGYADPGGFLASPLPAAPETAPPPTNVTVVPLDCRPSISFARNVNDDAQVGTMVQPLNPETEQIGDPAKNQGPARVRYGLAEVRLDRWDGSAWQPVAGKGPAIAGLPPLFGTWGPVPAGAGLAQNKLLLWSKCGYDHLRHSGPDWSNWFGANQGGPGGYPCVPAAGPSFSCLEFANIKSAPGPLPNPYHHPDQPDVSFSVPSTAGAIGYLQLTDVPGVVDGKTKALCARRVPAIQIDFASPVSCLHLSALCPVSDDIDLRVTNVAGVSFGPIAMTRLTLPSLAHAGPKLLDAAVAVTDVMRVVLTAAQAVCLLKVCGTLGPSIQATALVSDLRNHNSQSSAGWIETGNVLAPYTHYRLRVVTRVTMTGHEPADYAESHDLVDLAFFQTEGPPGLASFSSPASPATSEFQSGLGDLALYVDQTVPPTVSGLGAPPLLPRPVYRGYDVGVVFNEDYVDLMYRLAGRDLALLIYDRNNQPVRDDLGRLMVTDDPWGETAQPSLNPQETPWLALVNGCGCVPPIDQASLPHDLTLRAADERQILDADMLYEGRLMPLLLHEDFSGFAMPGTATGGGQLGRWQVLDLATAGGPSAWTITASTPSASRWITQTSAIGAATGWPGTFLVLGPHPGLAAADLDQPSAWTDYRVSLHLASPSAGAMGLAFRYVGAGTFYLFVMDRPNATYRLVRVQGGTATTLASTQLTYDLTHDYHLVVETVGDSIRVTVDGALVFDVTDDVAPGNSVAPITTGGLALYCQANAGAAFSEVKVHDFSPPAKCVYRFAFTASKYVDFFHHLHAFDDECWPAQCTLSDADLGVLYGRSVVDPNAAITDDEARAFEQLADNTLGTAALQLAERTEWVRVNRPGGADAAALLLRSDEPIDWTRISFSLAQSTQPVPMPVAPTAAKLVAVSFGSLQPEDERITLLIREPTNLTGHRIEKREVAPGPPLALDSTDAALSIWTTLYEFGPEPMAVSGTRIVIFSGNPDNPPAPESRTWHRFRAPTGAPGDVQFTTDAVDLRIISPQGDILHARRFLNDTTMVQSVGFRLLRKADGTACFLLPPATLGAGFSPQSFQITLVFRRNNTAIDPGSLVLSAAGLTSAEAVVLDIPWTTL